MEYLYFSSPVCYNEPDFLFILTMSWIKEKKTVLFFLAALLIIIAVNMHHSALIRPWMLDDSFISFRYAENLVNGQGVVFNPGEKVEGYTSFFWVMVLAAGKALGFNLIPFSKILGNLFGFGVIALLFFSYRFYPPISRTSSILAALFLGTCGIFTPWNFSGMETSMFMFLTTLLLLLRLRLAEAGWPLRQALFLGVLGALAGMTRPEGVLFSAILLLDLGIDWLRNRNKTVFYVLASFSLLYIPYFIWRFLYYGFLFPNTYYTKVGFGWNQIIRGFNYFSGFILPAALLLFLFVNFSMVLPRFQPFKKMRFLPWVIGLYILYVVSVGGDVWAAFRFFTPVIPLICLGAAVSLEIYLKKELIGKPAVIGLTLLIVAWNLIQFRTNDIFCPALNRNQTAQRGILVGMWLKKHAQPDAVLATNTAGSIPYICKLKTIDMLGLNDLHIAHRKIPSIGEGIAGHEKGDGEYVLSLKPDYIHFGSAFGSVRPWPGFISDNEIWENPEFHSSYKLIKVDFSSGDSFFIYKRIAP